MPPPAPVRRFPFTPGYEGYYTVYPLHLDCPHFYPLSKRRPRERPPNVAAMSQPSTQPPGLYTATTGQDMGVALFHGTGRDKENSYLDWTGRNRGFIFSQDKMRWDEGGSC